jgi:hypothetical protein
VTDPPTVPATDPDAWFPRNIDLRRAVLGVLIRRRGDSVSLHEICAELVERDRLIMRAPVSKRVSDVLRWQMRRGRVVRVKRGSYRFVPGSMSASTTWRCLHWRHVADQRGRR